MPHISPPMTTTLFTLGYQMRDFEEYLRILRQSRIDVLVDVRETPWSHKPGFSKNPLREALERSGIEYLHARFAGNPKTIRSTAASHTDCLYQYRRYLASSPTIMLQLEALIGPRLGAGQKVCLTCYERHPNDCHRGILAENWSGTQGRSVEHLAIEGCARLAQNIQNENAACA
jgi:uncharacterized protein (DUF488 family)